MMGKQAVAKMTDDNGRSYLASGIPMSYKSFKNYKKKKVDLKFTNFIH